MTGNHVPAYFHLMPESGCVGFSFPRMMRKPQWELLRASVCLVAPCGGGPVGVACFAISVARDGISLAVRNRHGEQGDARFVPNDWSSAWIDLSYGDERFAGRQAIEMFERVGRRIGAGVKKLHGKRGRAVADLEARENFEATVLCAETSLSRSAAIDYAFNSIERDRLPKRIVVRLEKVRGTTDNKDQKLLMNELSKDVASNIRKVIAAAAK